MESYSHLVVDKILSVLTADQLALVIKHADSSPFDDEILQTMPIKQLRKLMTEICEGGGVMKMIRQRSVPASTKATLIDALKATFDTDDFGQLISERSLHHVMTRLSPAVVEQLFRDLHLVKPPNPAATEAELVVIRLTLEGLSCALAEVPIAELASIASEVLSYGPKSPSLAFVLALAFGT